MKEPSKQKLLEGIRQILQMECYMAVHAYNEVQRTKKRWPGQGYEDWHSGCFFARQSCAADIARMLGIANKTDDRKGVELMRQAWRDNPQLRATYLHACPLVNFDNLQGELDSTESHKLNSVGAIPTPATILQSA